MVPHMLKLRFVRRLATIPCVVAEMCVSRVRLYSANHQWGKDPPKEVVG